MGIEKAFARIAIVPATPEHAELLALREGDARELQALGLTKNEAIRVSLAHSIEAETYLVDGEVAAIMGVATSSLLGGERTAWLLTGRP